MKKEFIGYDRNLYFSRIRPFFQTDPIKIIVGMRRVGKSTLLRQIRDKHPAKTKHLFIDKDLFDFDDLRTARDLVEHVEKYLPQGGALFIDEVQEIEDWEKALVSFQKKRIYDIFITGSNAHLLSSDLATRLAGRYLEFPVYPLNFREFLQLRKLSAEDGLPLFLKYGGLPSLLEFELKDSMVFPLLQGIYNTVLLKDVVQRNNLRNVRSLENICRFVFDNVGQIFSATSIAKFLKNQKIKINSETVIEYLNFLCLAQVVHRVPRYDVKGKKLLEIQEKFYLNDLGLRHAVLGFREGDLSQILENLVFLELITRGYEVQIGQLPNSEIDFIASKENEKIYIQVCYLLTNATTIDREFSALESVPDHHPKLVLSMDKVWGNDRNGVQRRYLPQWLLEAE